MFSAPLAAALLSLSLQPSTAFAPREALAAPQPVTRADLARAYIQFERTLAAHPPVAERRAEINRAFDRATTAFFTGSFATVIKQITQLAFTLEPREPGATVHADDLIASALVARTEPPVWVTAANVQPPNVAVTMLYALDVVADAELALTIAREQSPPIYTAQLRITTLPDQAYIERIALPTAPPPAAGRYDVAVTTRAGRRYDLGSFTIAAESFDAVRERNAAALDEIAETLPADSPALAAALAACRSRNDLLTDTPSDQVSAQFLIDPTPHAAEVALEIDALRAGRDPYARRPGDSWRTFTSSGNSIPLRLYAPADALNANSPMPLVIALHGAGGDENMFIDGYGSGAITTLARARGFIVAAPSTTSMMTGARTIADLITTLAHCYPIDQRRVYILGHSMGAGAAASLAATNPSRLAAAACIAGAGRFGRARTIPPTLMLGAELDPIIPEARVRAAAEAAKAAGLPVEYRRIDDAGHTLVVGSVLPDVIDWLFTHIRAE